MKTILCTLALCLSALTAQAGTGGITTHHQLYLTRAGNNTQGTKITWPIVYNNTAYDKAFITGPDNIKRGFGGKAGWEHKELTFNPLDPKIGETIVNFQGGGDGGPPPKHEHGPLGEFDFTKNGFLMYKTNWSGATSVTWYRDPLTCGSIFYSQGTEYGAWKFDTALIIPCPAPAPVASSGTVSTKYLWDLIFQKEGHGPVQQERIVEWTEAMRLDYFKVYGKWPKIAK